MSLKVRDQAYLRTHPLAFAIGAVAIIAGALMLIPAINIDTSSFGQYAVAPVAQLWAPLHILGGFGVCYGMLRGRPKAEAAGFAILAGTIGIDSLAVLDVRGFDSGLPAGSIIGSVAIGCAIRAVTLILQPAVEAVDIAVRGHDGP